jgi:quinol monooxygenase YgiN
MKAMTNTAFFRARPNLSKALGACLLELVSPTRSEAGCLRYEIYRSNDDPDAWFVYEDWRSQADFEAHMQTPYVKAFMNSVPELCEEDVEVCSYEKVS